MPRILGKYDSVDDAYHLLQGVVEKCGPRDLGWGCLYRSAMMLTKVLLKLAGRSGDCPSLGEFVTLSGGEVGMMCAPSVACRAVASLLRTSGISVSLDGEIQDGGSFPSVYLLSTRLSSGDHLSEEAKQTVLGLLGLRWSCGALGGPPRKATFILGRDEAGLQCMDPHMGASTFHVLHAGELDPTLALAFFLRSPVDQAALIAALREMDGCPDSLLSALREEPPKTPSQMSQMEVEDGWIDLTETCHPSPRR